MSIQAVRPTNISLTERVTPHVAQEVNQGWFNWIKNIGCRTLQYARYRAYSTKPPKESLERIDQAASQGLQRASIQHIPTPSTAPLQGQIDEVLKETENEAVSNRPTAEVGPLARIPGVGLDADVTRAPTAQARVAATDWKVEIDNQRERLTNKLSAYTALTQMCQGCKVDNLQLMDLVKKATEGENPESLWSLLTANVPLTFFQKIKAFWTYWIYYQTSLIRNTVDAYLGTFIESLKKDLTQDSDHTRTVLFGSMIKNAEQALIADMQATEDFAHGRGHGDLEDHRNRAIERHYNFSLPELCRRVCERQVDKRTIRVRFFTDFQKIPVVGWAFKGFEWFVNRFFIQSAMKSWVLPKALESSVTKGLEATQPENLPFTLNMTKFMTSQLEKLMVMVKEGSDSGETPEHIPGTERLPSTVKNLMRTLKLEKHTTAHELRKELLNLEKDQRIYKQTVSDSIEQGITDGFVHLFNFLNQSAKSGELFAKILELSCEPFSGDVKKHELLLAEYKQESLKLERTAENAVKEIVRQAVAKKMSSYKPETSKPKALKSFKDQKAVATTVMDRLSELTRRMNQKIGRSRQHPTDANGVQVEVVEFLQTMQVFANRKEFQDRVQGIDAVDRHEIWRIFTPLFDRAAAIQERVLKLQTYQDAHPKHAKVVANLRSITELLQSIRDQFHAQPRHLQTTFVQIPTKATEEIVKCLGSRAPVSIKLNRWIEELTALTQRISKEQEVLDAFHAIYPPRRTVENPSETGLLDQLLLSERGNPPRGFKRSTVLSQINGWLAYLPEQERRELQELIGDGRGIWSRYTQLSEAMQRIYSSHVTVQHQDKATLNRTLDEATTWTEDKIGKFTLVKDLDHQKMRREMALITEELNQLKREISEVTLELPDSLSYSAQVGFTGVVGTAAFAMAPYVTTAVGAYMPAWVPEWGSAVSGATKLLSGFASGAMVRYLTPGGKTPMRKKVGAAVAPLFAGSLSSWLLPQIPFSIAGRAITLGALGWAVEEEVKSYFEQDVFKQVWEIVQSANAFRLNPRAYKMATTRLLVELAE